MGDRGGHAGGLIHPVWGLGGGRLSVSHGLMPDPGERWEQGAEALGYPRHARCGGDTGFSFFFRRRWSGDTDDGAANATATPDGLGPLTTTDQKTPLSDGGDPCKRWKRGDCGGNLGTFSQRPERAHSLCKCNHSAVRSERAPAGGCRTEGGRGCQEPDQKAKRDGPMWGGILG